MLEKLEVILTGGVFQNKTLLELVTLELQKKGISYYYQKETNINDAGISLGQNYYYLQIFSNIESCSIFV